MGNVDTNGGRITWNKENKVTFSEGQPKLIKLIKGQELSKIAFSGSALVTNDKVIFLLRIVTENDKKTVFAFFSLKNAEGSEKMQFLPFDEVVQN